MANFRRKVATILRTANAILAATLGVCIVRATALQNLLSECKRLEAARQAAVQANARSEEIARKLEADLADTRAAESELHSRYEEMGRLIVYARARHRQLEETLVGYEARARTLQQECDTGPQRVKRHNVT